MYTYGDMMSDMRKVDPELHDHWKDARPWGCRGAMVVWLDNGRIYKVSKRGTSFVKQPLTEEEVRRKLGV